MVSQGKIQKSRLYRWKKKFQSKETGMNVPEIGITLGVMGVLAATATPLLSMQAYSLRDSLNLIEGSFKLARSKAMSKTTALRIKPDGSDRFIMESHVSDAGSSIYSCADAASETDSNGKDIWTKSYGFNSQEDMVLQPGVQVKSVTVNGTAVNDLTNWSLCFDARGMANKNILLTLEEVSTGQTKTLEVFSGGSLISYDSARFNTGATSPSGTTGTDSKLQCDKGEGNGSEGCDPGLNGDKGNDDED